MDKNLGKDLVIEEEEEMNTRQVILETW